MLLSPISKVIRMPQIWRQAGEAVRLGDEMVVEVLQVGVTHVRLAVTVPGAEPEYREVELALPDEAKDSLYPPSLPTAQGATTASRSSQIASGLSE